MTTRYASWPMLLAVIGVGQLLAAAQVDLLAAVQADGTSAQVVTNTEVPGITALAVDTVDATEQHTTDPTAGQPDILTVTTTTADQIANSAAAQLQSTPQDSLTGCNPNYCADRAPCGGCKNITSATFFAAAGPGRISRISRGGDKPDRPGVGDPPTTGVPPLVVCDVGGLTGTLMKYIPDDGRFKPENFRNQCLGSAAVACDHKYNTAGAATKPTKTNSCCSCFLYAERCFGKATTYVTDTPLSAGVDHVLVMPKDPCTGVENWNQKKPGMMCPGEAIWTEAQRVIDAAKLPDDYAWGAAINPVSRRGQHQMHIHLARVFTSVHTTIAYASWNLKLTRFDLDCGPNKGSTIKLGELTECKIAETTSTNPKYTVRIVNAPNGLAQEVTPFDTAYKTPLNKDNNDVLWTATLVMRVPWKKNWFAIITNTNGPAECFFNPGKDDTLDKGCSPKT